MSVSLSVRAVGLVAGVVELFLFSFSVCLASCSLWDLVA